uniref:T9SS type A sorting domain-containing protein n=1 Tax=Ignavibacterium album TaxID=591197 RepID=A0A832DJ23_9BACT
MEDAMKLLKHNYKKIFARNFSLLSLFFELFLFVNFDLFAQIPDTIWTKTFGGSNIDVGYYVETTSDGGFIITGYTRSYGTMSGRNVLLIKTDSFGNEQWIKAYGGNNDDEGNSVQQTSDGGFIICGYTKSYGAGGNDVFLVKTDSLGNELWNKVFGGASDEEGYSVLQTNDGGFLIAGATSSFGAGSRDIWLVKTDTNGNLSWTKTIGGGSSDGARQINFTNDGGYIITGWTFSYGPGAVGNAWLVKTDSLGNMSWNKFFGGSDVDRGLSVQQTSDGGYVLTGYTASSGFGLDDMLLIKTDSNGNLQWQKTFGGSGRDYGNFVQQTFDNGYIITGYTLSFGAGGDDLWLVRTDASGNLQWSKTYGGAQSDVGYCLQETIDGGYIIVGHTLSRGAGLHDVWLLRLESIIPVELTSFTAFVKGNSVELNWTTATETNNRGFEIQRSVIPSEARNLSWVAVDYVKGNGTTTEPNNYSYVDEGLASGKFAYRLKQIDYDGSFSYSDIIEVEINNPEEFTLEQNYPNPFNPATKIKFKIQPSSLNPFSKGEGTFTSLRVFDVLGNEVAVLVNEFKKSGYYEVEFDANNFNLTSGIYFYRLQAGSFIEVRKMIYNK